MSSPLISVIVPVYKVEPYLKRCVDSIRNQTYSNLEILLIDDGSPDRCGEMCDAFAKEDSRIRVFHKENGGQSSARNVGLDNMNGEYVAFVDSDDWIEPDMYQHLYGVLVRHNAQISCCGIQRDYPDGKFKYFNTNYPQESQICVYKKVEALRESLINMRITYSPCDKLYHKDVLENLRMTEGKIYEDMEILPQWIERADTIVYDPMPKYHYYMTPESTLRGRFNVRRFAEADIAKAKMEDYRIRYPELYDEAMGRYIAVCLSLIHDSCGVADCNQKRKELIATMHEGLPKNAVATMHKRERLKLYVLQTSLPAYEILMKIYDALKH